MPIGMQLLLLVIAAATQDQSLTLVPDLRIGDREKENFVWTTIGDIAVDPHGFIYVMLPTEREVRAFDADGRFLHAIGRSGSGPGEFRLPYMIGAWSDSIWVWDAQLRRISVFDNRGLLARGTNIGLPGEARLLSDGASIVRDMTRGFLWHVTPGSNRESAFSSISRTASRMRVRGRGRTASIEQPFADHDLWTTSPDGMAVFVVNRRSPRTSSGTFVITKLNTAGDTVFSKEYSYPAIALEDAVITAAVDSLIDMFVERARVWRREDLSEESIRRDLLRPRYLPPITDVVAGSDNTLWVKREANLEETDQWLVIDQHGNTGPTAVAPKGIRLLAVDRYFAWAVEVGEDYVEYVRRFRLVRQ